MTKPCEWTDSKGHITRTCGQTAARVLLAEKQEIYLCDFHRRLIMGAMVRQWRWEIYVRIVAW